MIAGRNITHTHEYIQHRFWTKVAVTQDTTRCWLWQRGCFKTGYGQFSFQLKPAYAHRMAYIFFHNVSLESIAEWEILHECDNPPCCNPHHLTRGTHAQNQDHIALRERTKSQKLSAEQVRYIRQQARYRSQRSIADELHTHPTNVSAIVRYKTRRHVLD